MRMACLGDSITYGLLVNYPYPGLVQDELGLDRVYNHGISGATIAYTDGYTSLCDNYLAMPKDLDIVMAMAGTNDYARGVELGDYKDTSQDTFYGCLRFLAKGLKRKYPDAYIFFATPYQRQTGTSPNAKGYVLYDYVKAIYNVCAEYDIPVLDFYNDGGLEDNYDLFTIDGLHPTQVFYSGYTAPMIAEFLRKNYN